MNKVNITGRTTRDIEIKVTPSGTKVANFTLAVNRRKNKDAPANTPDADFISCVAWGKTAELMELYVRKGDRIGISGRIETRNYDDPNIPGRKIYVTNVVVEELEFLQDKRSNSADTYNNGYYADPEPQYNSYSSQQTATGNQEPSERDQWEDYMNRQRMNPSSINISADDLPF